MWNRIKAFVMVCLMSVLLLPMSAHSSVVWSDDFNQALPPGVPSVGVFTTLGNGQKAWSTGLKGTNLEVAAFKRYNVGSLLPAKEGTIEFSLIRGNKASVENVFSLEGPNGDRILTATIFWDGFIPGSSVSMGIEHINVPGAGSVWMQDVSRPEYGQSKFYSPNHSLPSVGMGQRLVVALTWGETPDKCKILANGVALPGVVILPTFGAGKYFEEAANIVLGAEPEKGKAGGNDYLFSNLEFVRIHNVALDSMSDTTPPDAVTRIIADAPWGGENRVSWEKSPSPDVAFYEVFRGESAKLDFTKPYQTTSALEITDNNVIPGIEYFYSVVAVDKTSNKSEPSPIVTIKALSGDGPAITSILMQPAGRPVRPGDVINVTMTGASGGKASVTVDGLVNEIVLQEQNNTGRYVGAYPVKLTDLGDARATYRLVASLSDPYGVSKLAGPEMTLISIADFNDKTPPAVASVDHNAWKIAGLSGKLVPGDVLTVTLNGEAGGIASFRLVGISEFAPMTETAPGVYSGSYTVGWNANGDKVVAEAVLSDFAGNTSTLASTKTFGVDSRVRIVVTAKDALLPADRTSKTRLLVRAENANGDDVKGHELALTLSTTEEYTGVVGGGKVEDKFASKDDVDDIEIKWGGVTDAFGEIAATYTAGFAAKTAIIVAKDLTTGDIGAGWLNTFVASSIAIKLTPKTARGVDLAALRLSLSPAWLTADGRSKSRVKAWLTSPAGVPIANARINFIVAGDNGSIKVVRGVTDETGLAEADYRAGTMAGFVTILVSAPDYVTMQTASLELRSDAPAKIDLASSLLVLPADGFSTANLKAAVTDINDNPNKNVPVLFSVIEGTGAVATDEGMTDKDGVVFAKYTAGRTAGTAVVEARHTSRSPTEDELRRIYGTIFVPRILAEQDRARVTVLEWLVKKGDEVVKGQPVVKIASGRQTWTLTSPETGIFVREVRHAKDRIELADTIGYVEIDPLVWKDAYTK